MNYNINESGVCFGDLVVPWKEIEDYQNSKAIEGQILVKLTARYGRDEVYNYQLMSQENWDNLLKEVKDNDIDAVYLGEVLGKHSEVMFYWSSTKSVEVVTDRTEILKFYKIYGGSVSNSEADIIGSTYDAISDSQ